MCRIKRVDTLDSQTLDIQFDSGHVLLLDLNALRGDPAIAQLLDSRGLVPAPDGRGRRLLAGRPQTDRGTAHQPTDPRRR